jgi:hypothetical protein
LTVCYGVTPTDAELLAQADLDTCTGTPVLTRDDAAKTYTITCIDTNGCPITGSGSWSNYPECIIETETFEVCHGVVPTDADILAHVDLNSECVDTPVITRVPGTTTYTVSCTDANDCPCTGSGSWTELDECVIETETFEVCHGVVPTDEQILAHIDLNSECADTPVITRVPGTTTYTVSCTDANGCPCTGSGSWTELPECVIETETFSVPCNTAPTDDEILAHVDLNSECADTPVIIRGADNTYTVTCTDENGCPCSGSGYWTVEPCEVCETAWAFLDDWTCFPKTGNWGSLTEISPGDSLTLTGDVWAGRAMCDQTKGWMVGTATITVSATGYDLDLSLNDDCDVDELHVWVNNAKPVVDGGFSDKRWYKSESMNELNLDLTKPIWVAVHTVTCCSACNDGCTYPAPK